MTPEYLEKIIREHRIDYVVHGNDPCIVDGKVCVFVCVFAFVCLCV